MFGLDLSLRFQLVWAELQGSEVNPSSLGIGDPPSPARFLARVSSARGGRNRVLLLGRGETRAERDSPLIGSGAKAEARPSLWSPILPEIIHNHELFFLLAQCGLTLQGSPEGRPLPLSRRQGRRTSAQPVFIIPIVKHRVHTAETYM